MRTDIIENIKDNICDYVDIPVELCRPGAQMPEYAREGDAGMDVYAADDVEILPGQTVLVPTGLKLAVPVGYEFQVRPRSGLSLRTAIRIPNSPGTIDSGYRGEVGIIMSNTSLPTGSLSLEDIRKIHSRHSEYPVCDINSNAVYGLCVYQIHKGDRIAQLVLHKVPTARPVRVESVADIGIDRQGGFGSTGVS